MSPELAAAFAATAYRAPPYTLRIGEPCPDMGAPCWAFVTAWNPDSEPREHAANVRDLTQLQDDLTAAGWRWLPAEGVADAGDWREPSVLVLGMTEVEAVALGRRWRQVAVVVGERGGLVRLLACSGLEPGQHRLRCLETLDS